MLLGTRPRLDVSRTQAFEKISSRSRRRCYTQLGLAEALRFRSQSDLKRHEEDIRESAFDTIQSMALSELYIPATKYLAVGSGLLVFLALLPSWPRRREA